MKKLLELCITKNDQSSWSDLLESVEELVRRTFFCVGSSGPLRYADFVEWFPGWLYQNKKLHALYAALLREPTSENVESEESFLSNYFVTIVKSAVADWYRQNKTSSHLANVPTNFAKGIVESPRGTMEEIRHELRRLNTKLRVPFWLRHLDVLGPMEPHDCEWLALENEMSAVELLQLIDREVDAIWPQKLSSAFIGGLLKLVPDRNGKFAAVDQRIRRSRDLLRQLLTSGDEAS